MTVSTKVEPMRIVSIYPYTRGFAYAVMDSALEVIESRLFDIKEYDHQKTMELSQNVILKHQPSIVILENTNHYLGLFQNTRYNIFERLRLGMKGMF